MRIGTCVLATCILATPLFARQTQQAPAPAPQVTPKAPLVIYQLDLVPTGHALVVGKPRQVGDAYFVEAFPERKMVKVPKSKVKSITPRTKDLNQEVIWQIDLVPSGRLLAAEEPVLKGKTYSVKKWQGGNLMSVRQTDVAKVTKLTGLDAFKVEQQEKGATRIDNLALEGTSDIKVIPGAEPVPEPAPSANQPPPQGVYGYPAGISEAYPQPNAVQERPGDVPKAAPVPTPHP